MPSTGVRNINSLIRNAGDVTGTLSLQRIGPIVTIIASNLRIDGSGSSQLCSLPSGFGASTFTRTEWCVRDQPQYFDVYTHGAVWASRLGQGKAHTGTIIYTTDDPWPSTLPGTAL